MIKPKLILVGEGAVGKSSIIQQYIEKRFNEAYLITVGSDKSIKDLNINGKNIRLEIWDTAGQDKYRGVNKIFMKNTKIALLVYDITDKKSFEQLNNWINHVNEANKNENIIFGIAANKSDLFETQVVSTEEGKKFAQEHNCLFFETSAKDYGSIEKAFYKLAEVYLEKIDNKKTDINNNNNDININNNNQTHNNENDDNKTKINGFENEIDEKIVNKDNECCSYKCFIF